MSTRTLDIVRVAAPRDLDDADARDFLDMIEVLNRGVEHDVGTDHLRIAPSEVLPAWHVQRYVERGGHVARHGDRAVGAIQWSMSTEAGSRNLEFDLATLPDVRGDGVTERLLERTIADARAAGRAVLQTYSLHRLDTGLPTCPSPTGFGAVPRDAWTRFYLDQGFTLQQVERNSIFDLRGSLDAVRAMRDAAREAAGIDYRVQLWSGSTPERFREAFAYVLSRMSTDVPLSGLDITEESWDVARVEHRDRRLADGGLHIGVAAVEHVPSGRIVAYNELGIGQDRSRPTDQWGTLVVKEHRGRRLGTLVKCENLLRWAAEVPTSPFVSTFNAEENRPMLDVNEAIGFVPFTVGGAWQRVLE